MSIAPIVKSVVVPLSADRAFELFTRDIGRWWKPGANIAKGDFADIVIERQAGGRWFEVNAQGVETQWGKVIAFDPPHRLLLGWQLTAEFKFDPDFSTEVEVRFEPQASGETQVTLEHRQLERFGDAAPKVAASVTDGWGTMVARYADFAREKIDG
jgi:uncharacterized protein YndB with AHSA1/START domain